MIYPSCMSRRTSGVIKLMQIATFVVAAAALVPVNTPAAEARETNAAAKSNLTMTPIRLADLPSQGRDTLQRIRKGGPFEHAKKDGSVFGNFERVLPKQPRGFYKEYTVATPYAKNRGARRIVCGGNVLDAATSPCYYTDDHYASFKRIQE